MDTLNETCIPEAPFDFEQWQQHNRERREAMRSRLITALINRDVIIERLGSVVTQWYLGKRSFIEPYASDPDYIADHLVSRHFGFGTPISINGVRYNLGREETFNVW